MNYFQARKYYKFYAKHLDNKEYCTYVHNIDNLCIVELKYITPRHNIVIIYNKSKYDVITVYKYNPLQHKWHNYRYYPFDTKVKYNFNNLIK